MWLSGFMWLRVAKSGEVAKSGKKCLKVAKSGESGEKWGKVRKSG